MKNTIEPPRLRIFAEKERRPQVGLGVVIVKEQSILIGTRIGSHCSGQRCVPGGHLEFGESIEDGCMREVREEADLIVKLRSFSDTRLEWHVTNNILEGKHYVGIFTIADWVSGEPKVMEPNKCKEWVWLPYFEVLNLSKPGCAWLPAELFEYNRCSILNID